MITRAEIFQIAANEPAVYLAVQSWRNGDLTWEEAMMMAVKVLATQKAEVIKHALAIEQNKPFSITAPQTASP